MNWVGIIATVVTSITAIAAIVMAWQANKLSKKICDLEEKKHQQNEVEKEKYQANKVSAWVADVRDEEQDKKWKHVGILVQNLSEEPVYEVLIQASCQALKERGEPYEAVALLIDLLPPGVYYSRAKNENGRFIDFVQHHSGKTSLEAWDDPRPYAEFSPAPKPVTLTSRRSVSAITFTDSNSNQWIRDKKGKLARKSG